MKSVVFFCLFFYMAPLFLTWIMKVRDVMSGPISDEPYDREQYRIKVRRAVIQLAIFTMLMLAGLAIAIYANLNLPEQLVTTPVSVP